MSTLKESRVECLGGDKVSPKAYQTFHVSTNVNFIFLHLKCGDLLDRVEFVFAPSLLVLY